MEFVMKKILVVLAALLLFASWAAAEEKMAANASQSKERELVLDPVTVVGTRTEMTESKYPGSVGVLSFKDLVQSPNIIQNLSRIPGFETGGDRGRSIGEQFTIRGFGYQSEERVIIKQDDIRRSASMFSNHISTFRTDPDILREVEVVKGSSSISHGGGAIGGVVGMTTKDARDFLLPGQTAGAQVKGRYDHNNHYSGSVALYGTPFDERYELLLFYKNGHNGDIRMAESGNPDTDFNEYFYTLFLKGAVNITESQKITTSFFKINQDVDTVWQSLYHSEYPDDGAVTGIVGQQDFIVKYEYSPEDIPFVDLALSGYHSYGYYDRTADYRSRRLLIDYKNEDEIYGLTLKNKSILSLGPVRQEILLGADYSRREEDARHLSNGKKSDFGSMPNAYNDFGVYAQDEIYFFDDRLMLLLGGRYDRFARSVDSNDDKYVEGRFSPRVGASFEIFSGFSLLANYSEAFRAPTPHETSSNGPLNPHYWYLPNSDLKPEISKEYEAGFSYVAEGLFGTDLDLFAKAMYFEGRIEDMISFETLPERGMSPDNSPYGTYKNIDRAKRRGLEGTLRMAFRGLNMDASYEHLKQYDAETGRNVPNTFADKVRLGLAYTFDGLDLTIGGDVSYWFKPKQNPDSRVFGRKRYYYARDDYTICNLLLKWEPHSTGLEYLDGSTEVALGVNNIFDHRYLNAREYEDTGRSGKGRNIFLTLTKKF